MVYVKCQQISKTNEQTKKNFAELHFKADHSYNSDPEGGRTEMYWVCAQIWSHLITG